jgi:maleylacetate reductase
VLLPDWERALGSGWTHTALAQRVHFGAGSIDRVGEILRQLSARRVLLVTTAGRSASEGGERLRTTLGRALAVEFTGVRSHVPASTVRDAVSLARQHDVEALVSFGGGSCADTAKAVSFFLEQERGTPGVSYLDRPVVPHVAVPTTYSGAELTPNFGVTDEASKVKQTGGSPTTAPIAAVYDPLLTLDTPVDISAATGMNALAHGVEAAYSPSRTPEAELLALGCIRGVGSSLPAVVDDPDDLTARTAMLSAAVLGGRCLQNAGMGAHHGLAQLLGGRTGRGHGILNGVLLAPVLRFNLDAIGDSAYLIGEALGDPDDPAAAVDRFRERIGLRGRLSEVGVTLDDIEAVARTASSSPSVRANPRPMSEDEARALLEGIF